MISFEEFSLRASRLQAEIAESCMRAGRRVEEVTLVAVTKNHPVDAVEYAARYGLTAVGENRVQEALGKRKTTSAKIRCELIGHLQSNKARLAAENFDRVQSVDSEKLLGALDRAANELGRPLAILLQINAGQDPAKFGADPLAAPRLLEVALGQRHLRVEGLMTIAPLSDDPAVAERTFTNLRTIRDQLVAQFGVALPELSMGMSNDLSAAIAAGSTQVRIGTALFGAR